MSPPRDILVARLPKNFGISSDSTVNVSPTQVKYNSKAHDLCLELADFLSREGSASSSIYIAEAANTFPERAKLVVARAMLAHSFEQWKERLGRLKPENTPPDRLFPDRSLYVWPSVIKDRKIETCFWKIRIFWVRRSKKTSLNLNRSIEDRLTLSHG